MGKRRGKQQARKWQPGSGRVSKADQDNRQRQNRRDRREAVVDITDGLEMYEWLSEVAKLAD